MNRKNLIGTARGEVEEANYLAEVQRDQVRQAVIKAYQDCILKQRMLKIKSKRLETSKSSNFEASQLVSLLPSPGKLWFGRERNGVLSLELAKARSR